MVIVIVVVVVVVMKRISVRFGLYYYYVRIHVPESHILVHGPETCYMQNILTVICHDDRAISTKTRRVVTLTLTVFNVLYQVHLHRLTSIAEMLYACPLKELCCMLGKVHMLQTLSAILHLFLHQSCANVGAWLLHV